MTFQSCTNSVTIDRRSVYALLLTVPLLFASACGGGGGGSTAPPPPSATITSVSISCTSASVQTGQTSQCSAKVSGTGSYSSGVTWTVNGTSGGNATYGTISAAGLYQAPATAPAAYIVTVAAVSSMDSTKSGSVPVLVAGTIASVTQPIVASAGGTISLPGGNSATIPAGVLNADSVVTLQLTSLATQPTNALFGGVGPSLFMSFSPALGAAANALIKPNLTSGTSDLTFVLQGGQGLSGTQLSNALGVLDVNDGTSNYFALASTYDATQNLTTLQVDPSVVQASSTLQVGLTSSQANSLGHTGNAWLQVWNDGTTSFSDAPSGYCPTGPRTLVLVHGMFSSVQDSFGQQIGWAASASFSPPGPYSSVLGVDYQWWNDINTSAQSMGDILDSLFDSSCSYTGSFDIEAHSEGTVVTLASTGSMSANTRSKLQHIVLVAGPIDGTPAAQNAADMLTFYLNLNPEDPANVLMPAAINDAFPFINELQSYSKTVVAAQTAAEENLPATEIIAAGGDKGYLYWWGTWLDTHIFLNGDPNDGIIPVSSALPSDSSLPNLVRLAGNDPSSGDYPYPDNHTSLVDNPGVIPAILSALNGTGATSLVTLSVTPQSPTLLPGQSVTLTATVTNALNPQLQWSIKGGTANGTLSSSTGATVQYTAPQVTGGPYQVTATMPAIVPSSSGSPLSSSANITVMPASNPAPTITLPLLPASLPVSSPSQALTINGTGFLASSTVTFNGINHAAAFVSASELTISLSAGDLATAGAYPVVVTNPTPGGGSATATFNVTASTSGISINPSSAAVPAGAVQTFAAIVPGGGSVDWSVQEGTAGGTITTAGIYTAPSTTGTFHVVATNTTNSAQTATATVNVIAAPAYSVLYSFPSGFESAGLIQGVDGNFYGTNEMIAYKIDGSGNFTQLAQLSSSPDAPISPVIQASDGDFYGTVSVVGSDTTGEIFKMDTSGNFTIPYSFTYPGFGSTGGAWPWAALIQGRDGYFYGTTYGGGNTSCTPYDYGVPAYGPYGLGVGWVSGTGCGTVFRMDASGNVTVLYSFSGQTDGNFPQGPLIQGKDGSFYGTTSAGGAYGDGTVFKMDASGNLNVLHSFSGADGSGPVASLLQGTDSNLYGTTACLNGCTSDNGGGGEVFKVNTSGNNFTVLHTFSGSDGWSPVAPLIQGSDGSFYGTTWAGGDLTCGTYYFNVGSNYPYSSAGGCGTVFKMDSAGNVTVLHAFEEPQSGDGNAPYAGLLFGTDGNLYGTTYYGGTSIYFGTVFRLTVPTK